jgi:hypothetical protein
MPATCHLHTFTTCDVCFNIAFCCKLKGGMLSTDVPCSRLPAFLPQLCLVHCVAFEPGVASTIHDVTAEDAVQFGILCGSAVPSPLDGTLKEGKVRVRRCLVPTIVCERGGELIKNRNG